jgi:hypothetical protein
MKGVANFICSVNSFWGIWCGFCVASRKEISSLCRRMETVFSALDTSSPQVPSQVVPTSSIEPLRCWPIRWHVYMLIYQVYVSFHSFYHLSRGRCLLIVRRPDADFLSIAAVAASSGWTTFISIFNILRFILRYYLRSEVISEMQTAPVCKPVVQK